MKNFAYVAGGGFDRHISMHRRDGLDARFGPGQREQQRECVIDASIGIDDNPLHQYYFAGGVSAGAGAALAGRGGLSVSVRPSASVTETKIPPGSPVCCG